jgi:hypothetical protein
MMMMRTTSALFLLVAAVVVFPPTTVNAQEFAFVEDYAIKANATSERCFANNSNCDWNVGVWTINYQYTVYSCSGNGVTTQPDNLADACCTSDYQVPATCVNGYREDDGVLVQVCVSQETRFDNKSSGVTNQRTLVVSTANEVISFEDGINIADSPCRSFRQLSLDSYVTSATPFGLPDLASCPDFPLGYSTCDQSSSGFANFGKARRRIPASRNAGYTVTKNFNSQGSCSLDNGNCDWMTGIWDGYVVAQGFSARYVAGEQNSILPSSASDVRCAKQPYTSARTCSIGYSTVTGELVVYCHAFGARIIPVDSTYVFRNGAFVTDDFNEQYVIRSLRNGMVLDIGNGQSACTPMDRFDSDTVVFNAYPTYPYTNCIDENISPDLNVRCEEDGANSVFVAYGVLVRGYGAGGKASAYSIVEKSDDYIFIFSSGSTLASSFSVVLVSFLLHGVLGMFWE